MKYASTVTFEKRILLKLLKYVVRIMPFFKITLEKARLVNLVDLFTKIIIIILTFLHGFTFATCLK